MKTAICLMLLLAPFALSSERTYDLVVVPMPLWIDVDDGVLVTKVPTVIQTVSPEANFTAISLPYVPPSTAPGKGKNINLANIAGIVIHPKFVDMNNYLIEIDYSKSAKNDKLGRSMKLLKAIVECLHKIAGEKYVLDIRLKGVEKNSDLHQHLQNILRNKVNPKDSTSSER